MVSSTRMTVEDLLNYPKFGSGIGFRRLSELLHPMLNTPWGADFETIKITGSNGKGSVTALVHGILRGLGVNCGRHTSPHLVRFHERIVVGDAEITDPQLKLAFEWLGSRIEQVARKIPGDQFGSFELITALCLRAFYDAELTSGVMEVGIGGRYDPLRLLPGRLVALTSVDLEHTDLLGKTKELIAYEKADLCPDGGTIVAIRRDSDLWDRIAAYCRMRNIALINANDKWIVELISDASDQSLSHMKVSLTSGQFRTQVAVPLVGTFQLDNISIACTVAEIWAKQYLAQLSTEQWLEGLIRGLTTTKWPGRFEQISVIPPVIIDVGHSPDACERLIQSIAKFLPRHKLLLVTGVSYDKAVADILQILVQSAQEIICTRAYHKGESVQRISGLVRELAPSKDVWDAKTIEEAVSLAKQIATSQGMTILVAGGLFLAIEFRTAWHGGNPRELRFY